MGTRKLGRNSSQRRALLRGLTTDLLWYGRITTTEARAKEIRGIADSLLTLAINEYDKTVKVKKTVCDRDEDGKIKKDKDGNVIKVEVELENDAPSKLNARRKIMAYVYDIQEKRNDGEDKDKFIARTKDNKHPLVEKMFREYGPKYRARNEEKNCAGGYTRIIKMGPRRGDNAEEVIIELV